MAEMADVLANLDCERVLIISTERIDAETHPASPKKSDRVRTRMLLCPKERPLPTIEFVMNSLQALNGPFDGATLFKHIQSSDQTNSDELQYITWPAAGHTGGDVYFPATIPQMKRPSPLADPPAPVAPEPTEKKEEPKNETPGEKKSE